MADKKRAVKGTGKAKAAKGSKTTAAKRTTKTQRDNPLADPALKKRWDAAIARYRDALRDETQGWDERYEALDEIINSQPPYYLAGGYKDATSFLRAEAPSEERRTIRTYIRVARHFDPIDEANYGITKLDLLVSYLEVKTGKAPQGKIDPEAHRIRLGDSKTAKDSPFSTVSTEQLRLAIRALRAGKETQASKESPLIKQIRALLSQHELSTVGVSLRGGRITLSGIEPASIPALVKALGAVKSKRG